MRRPGTASSPAHSTLSGDVAVEAWEELLVTLESHGVKVRRLRHKALSRNERRLADKMATWIDDEWVTEVTPLEVYSVEQIDRFLRTACTYRPDAVDHWQRPLEFEEGRIGDCEDFAIWAWNKLHRLGYDAEFCLGLLNRRNSSGSVTKFAHAWTESVIDGRAFVFDEHGMRPKDSSDWVWEAFVVRTTGNQVFLVGPVAPPSSFA